MKKDIFIPKVEGVYIAIVNEYNDVYKTQDWNAYIINDKDVDLDTVIIVILIVRQHLFLEKK